MFWMQKCSMWCDTIRIYLINLCLHNFIPVMFTHYMLYSMCIYVCLLWLQLLGGIITWPGHTAVSPSVPSGPLQSVMAETGSLDTADALSLQRAGGTLPCWTWAGNKIKNVFHRHVKRTDTQCFSWWAKLDSFIMVLGQTHYTGLKVFSHMLSYVTVADNCLHSINEEGPVSLCHYLNHISCFFWKHVLREVRIHERHSISLVHRLLQLRHLVESNRTASGSMSPAAYQLQKTSADPAEPYSMFTVMTCRPNYLLYHLKFTSAQRLLI